MNIETFLMLLPLIFAVAVIVFPVLYVLWLIKIEITARFMHKVKIRLKELEEKDK